MSPISSQVLL